MILHLVVSSAILVLAMAAAAWMPRLTARTRHAILIAGMASLLVPSTLIARAIEQSGTKVLLPMRMAMPVMNGPAAAPAASPLPWAKIAVVLWLGIALLVFLRALLITHRLVANATRAGTPPPARTVAALEAARQRLALHTAVDLIASPLCEAPAVLRVLRPIIVLPSDGCQSLGDDELESLLCHECAHVARRDNLVGFLETIAGAVFWFDPLVWLARRRIASAREEACDERVADAAMSAETYVGALAKLCRSLVAPGVTAVSCMANAHLKERIEHLMNYESLRNSALPHRFITAFTSLAVVALIFTGGVLAAAPGGTKTDEPYTLNYSITRGDDTHLIFHANIMDMKTGDSVGETSVAVRTGGSASSEITREGNRWRVEAMTKADGSGTITLIAWMDGAEIQRTPWTFPAKIADAKRTRTYSGEPISMNLVGADIRDLLRTVAEITDLELDIAPDVKGTVNANFINTPWDEALERVLRENGLAYRVEGKKLRVFKPAP